MAKGRIANIVDQSRTSRELTDIRLRILIEGGIKPALDHRFADIVGERPTYGGHFERVCESRPDKITSVKWKDLCLILQTPERGALNDPVVILLEF